MSDSSCSRTLPGEKPSVYKVWKTGGFILMRNPVSVVMYVQSPLFRSPISEFEFTQVRRPVNTKNIGKHFRHLSSLHVNHRTQS